MIWRLRQSADALADRLRSRLFSPAPGRTCGAVKGCTKNVIVVKPDNPMFTEAIFILREDIFHRPEISRRELLRQAQEAAREYTAQNLPPRRRPGILAAALSVLFLAALVLLLHCCGLIW